MKLHLSYLLLSTLVLLAGACSNSEEEQESSSPNQGRQLEFTQGVSFLDKSEEDTLTTIEVAVADDANERSQGLMDVKNLPESHGMLFIFEDNEPRSFWMANTPLPLDIMFVNEDLEIVRIHHSTRPYSDKNLKSEEPAKYVIETNAGFSISHDIQEGMTVSFQEERP